MHAKPAQLLRRGEGEQASILATIHAHLVLHIL